MNNYKTHLVLDLFLSDEEGCQIFAGTEEECFKFVSEQGIGYRVAYMTDEELRIHNPDMPRIYYK
jgi:hypothetical protein